MILLINKTCYNISPLLYYFFFSNTKTILPNGSEIIIFYLFLNLITTSISYDYLKECRTDKNEPAEKSLLIKNELEYSITDITNNTERNSIASENSINLNKNKKIFLTGENENVEGIFKSKRKSMIAVLKDNLILKLLKREY